MNPWALHMAITPELQPWVLGFTFVIGLVIGSFLNVVGLRFLADESITLPPSSCPHCKARIRPQDNIPVISYILLGGRCRDCKAGISIQYPLIELATGVLFTLVVWFFGVSLASLLLLFMVANLIVIFITDLRESYIFQINSLSLIPAGLIYNALSLGPIQGSTALDLGAMIIHVPDGLISALIAIGISFAFFEGMILLSMLVFGTDGFGHGDTHLMMGAGAFLGWPLTVLALVLGFIAQTIPAIPMLVIQWIQNKQWTSLISGAAALIFGTLPMFTMSLGFAIEIRTAISLLCIVLTLVALIVFLKQVRTSQSFTYLPLGPALVIGILVALFWGQPIIAYYQTLMQTH
jgi:leader peptidase (prepilin peptidase)/N-methyltransferase